MSGLFYLSRYMSISYPTMPVLYPASHQNSCRKKAVVVFPFVPVIPMILSFFAGKSKNAADNSASASLLRYYQDCSHKYVTAYEFKTDPFRLCIKYPVCSSARYALSPPTANAPVPPHLTYNHVHPCTAPLYRQTGTPALLFRNDNRYP